MKAKSPYTILGVKKTSTDAEIKQAFRALAKKYHPDANPGNKKAEEKFKEVAAAWEILGDAKKRADYDKTGRVGGPTVLPSRKDKYEILEHVQTGDIADVYRARSLASGRLVAVKIVRSPRDNDLLENEAKNLKVVYPPDGKLKLYLPKMIESFKIDDGAHRQVNVMEWLSDYYSFEEIRRGNPILKIEHGVWMFNRTLEILGHVHRKGIVHGAVLPPHLLAFGGVEDKSEFTHGVRLIGWSYSVPKNTPIRAAVSKWETLYPPEVWKKMPATPATDIFMAARSMVYVLGGHPVTHEYPSHIPGYIRSFLKGCTLAAPKARPQDAWELHKEFKEHMEKHYGPKKYVRFDMPMRA